MPSAPSVPAPGRARSVQLPVPPWLVRRAVIAPLMPLFFLLALATLPLALAGQGAVAAVLAVTTSRDIRWRLPRVWGFAVLYLLAESVCLLLCLLLWVGTGFGWRTDRPGPARLHLLLLRRLLAAMIHAAGVVFRFRLVVDEPVSHPQDVASMAAATPIVVLGRHAGPGASFVLIHLLLSRYDRRPRIVLKEQLRLDPAVDVLLSRLGCGFIRNGPGGGDRAVAQIEQVAAQLTGRDALVIFPEGKDWTPARHRSAVALLRRRGRAREADRAARLEHVLPPRPAGTLAALSAAPAADVVVFTHTGHDDMRDLRSTWKRLPLRRDLHLLWWRVPREELPVGEAAQTTWLFDSWELIDVWIDEQTELRVLTDRTRPAGAAQPGARPEQA